MFNCGSVSGGFTEDLVASALRFPAGILPLKARFRNLAEAILPAPPAQD